eukprot:scaffold215334_cov30-Tisochrysis_lutea.AAC.1
MARRCAPRAWRAAAPHASRAHRRVPRADGGARVDEALARLLALEHLSSARSTSVTCGVMHCLRIVELACAPSRRRSSAVGRASASARARGGLRRLAAVRVGGRALGST